MAKETTQPTEASEAFARVSEETTLAGGRRKPSRTRGKTSATGPSSAQEELARFRGMPVVGTLPWRTQYRVLAAVLALSLLTLLALALSAGPKVNPAAGPLREAVAQIQTQVDRGLLGEGVDARALAAARGQAQRAAASLRLSQWTAVDRELQAWETAGPQAARVGQETASARTALQQGLIRATPPWNSAGASGAWNSPEAVGLAQVMGAYRTLDALLAGLGAGAIDPTSVDPSAAVAAQGFEAFRVSPLIAQDVPLTRAWKEMSAAWAVAGPALESLATNRAAVAAQASRLKATRLALAPLSAALDARIQADASSAVGWGTGLVGALALLSLALLLGVAWKQQRWQVLNAQAGREHDQASLENLMADLARVGEGDLTRRMAASETPMGALAQVLNEALEKIRRLMVALKKANQDNAAAAGRVSEAAGALVDEQRQRLALLQTSAEDVLSLIESIEVGADEVATAKGLTDNAQTAALAGRHAAGESMDKMQEVRTKVEEAAARAQRLKSSAADTAVVAAALQDLAEQLKVLAIQAGLQSAKAGEAGQGFKVVAKNVQDLALETDRKARGVTGLVETGLLDLEALDASMAAAMQGVDAGSRLTDKSNEAWEEVCGSIEKASKSLAALRDNTKGQEEMSANLDRRTRHDLEQADKTIQQTKETSAAVLEMEAAIRSVDTMVSKFKA